MVSGEMLRVFALLALAIMYLTPLAGAEETFEPFPSVCDRTLTDTVRVASDEIEVRTSFLAAGPGAASVWPAIRQTATYGNGDILIDRQVGEKFIDDEVPCEVWYEEAHHQLVRALAAAPPVGEAGADTYKAEIGEVRECLESPETCEVRNDVWRFTIALRSMSLEQFDSLIGEDPRIFYLKEGAYLGQLILFDVRRRQLIPILEGGC